jgi:hypothetical protein
MNSLDLKIKVLSKPDLGIKRFQGFDINNSGGNA